MSVELHEKSHRSEIIGFVIFLGFSSVETFLEKRKVNYNLQTRLPKAR